MTITLNKWQLELVRGLLFKYVFSRSVNEVRKGIALEVLKMTEPKP